MTSSHELPTEYAARVARGGIAPDRKCFVDPWAEGPLIRYLAHLRHQYSYIGLSHPETGELIEIDKLFVRRRLGIEPGGSEIGLDLLDVLEHGQRAVVLGPPGSGRSTLLNWLIHQLTEPDSNEVVKRLGPMVPVPVIVEQLALQGEGRTIQAIVNQLRRQPFWYEGLDALLPDLVRRGQVLFLVDGLEDLRDDGKTREVLRDALLDGMWRFPSCSWVITSDTATYERAPLKEEALESGPLPPSLANLPMAKGFEIPAWHLQPLDSIGMRRFVEAYVSLTLESPVDQARVAKDLRMSITRSLLGLDLSRSPGLLTLLAESHGRKGMLSVEDSDLYTSLVESTATIIGRVPGSEAIPRPVLLAWLEAMARDAEIARFAAEMKPSRLGNELSMDKPASLGSILDRDWAAGLLRVLTLSRTGKDPGDAAVRTLIDELLCVAGVLVARAADGLSFVRLDVQQILAGRSLGRVLEVGQEGTEEAKEALDLLRSWVRRPDARPVLLEVFRVLGQRPALAERLYKKLIGGRRRRTLGELDDLGPLTHALCNGLAGPLPDRVRGATDRFCADAITRWVAERGRVPHWASDLSPIKDIKDIRTLDISGCRWVRSLDPIHSLHSLQRLDLHDCVGIQDLGPIGRLVDLQWLDLRRCSSLKSLSALVGLPALQWLDLGGCTRIRSLKALDGMDQIQALALHGCTQIDDISPLSSVRSLRALVISGCTGITDLSPLKQLRPGGQVWVRGSGVRKVPKGLRWEVIGLED